MEEKGHHNWKRFKQAVKKFVYWIGHVEKKEFFTFLLFLLIAATFWFLQNIQSTLEAELTIPIRYREVPDNITITNKLVPAVHVTIRDKGGHLYGYLFHKKKLGIEINLMNWRTPSGIGKIPVNSLETKLSSKLKPSAQILRMSPDSILVYYVEKESKTVPIHLNAKINPLPQHLLVNEPTITPSYVTVYAPIGILDSLKVVETAMLKVDNIGDTTLFEVALNSIDGVQFSQEKIQVSVPIEAFTEGSFTIPVTGIHFPENHELRSFPPTIQVSFLVNESSYGKISANDFQISVDYQDIIKSPNELCSLKIIRAPENVKRVVLKPELTDCLIEKIQ